MKCEKLDVWKKSCNVPVEIYRYFSDFKDQVTRSSLSIPSNIVEEVEKIFDKDMVRFLDIARASCAELTTQIYWHKNRLYRKRYRISMERRIGGHSKDALKSHTQNI